MIQLLFEREIPRAATGSIGVVYPRRSIVRNRKARAHDSEVQLLVSLAQFPRLSQFFQGCGRVSGFDVSAPEKESRPGVRLIARDDVFEIDDRGRKIARSELLLCLGNQLTRIQLPLHRRKTATAIAAMASTETTAIMRLRAGRLRFLRGSAPFSRALITLSLDPRPQQNFPSNLARL